MRKDGQRGAIVVEATIALTAFIFAIFTILSVVNICFVQARMAVALNAAAKEISQYSYLYYALGVDSMEAKFDEGTADSKELAENTIDGVSTFMSSLSGAANSAESGDFDRMIDQINTGVDNVDSLATQYADKLKDDPKGFILGMGKMAVNELKEDGKVVLAQILAKTFMQKNLMTSPDDDADEFLRRFHVVDGMDGLDFNYTTFLAYGKSNEIQLVVTYDIEVIQLLDIDFTFTIRQCSKTTAWGNGISQIHPENNDSTPNSQNLWALGPGERGKALVAAEKEKYQYTSSGDGYDAYNNREGKNEFVTIVSANTHDATNSTATGIKNKLSAGYNALYSGVANLDSTITVQDQNGQSVTLQSNEESRTYRVVIVVPDDADMSMVAEGVKAFKESHPGVEVSVRQGYGSPE